MSSKNKEMPTENIEKEIAKLEKINIFFRKNNYLIVIFLVAMMILTMCNTSKRNDQIEKVLKENTHYLKKNIQTIGFVTATGTILTIDRKPIDYNDERIKEAIVGLSAEPFLQGSEEIRAGKVYASTKDMILKNAKFHDLYMNYTKNKKDVYGVLSAIHKTVSALYYPEYITVLKKDISTFNVIKDIEHKGMYRFTSTVRYKIKTKSWIVQLNKWVNQDLTITMEFGGEIDPAKYASADNLLGFKLTKIKVPLLQKPNISELRED